VSAKLEIVSVGAPVAETSCVQLADVLLDCVEGGASVSFMSPFCQDQALAFFRKSSARLRQGMLYCWQQSSTAGLSGRSNSD
jgi:hypothetical protein